MIICGLDIGGTKVEAAFFEVVKETQDADHWQEIQISGEVLFLRNRGSRRIPTERNRGYKIVIENISNLIKELSKELTIDLKNLIISPCFNDKWIFPLSNLDKSKS